MNNKNNSDKNKPKKTLKERMTFLQNMKITKKTIIISATAVLIIAVGVFSFAKLKPDKKQGEVQYEIVKAERTDIVRYVDASSTVQANDTYNVTSLVTGEILSDTFNEGDIVTKDQLLYTIDYDDAQRSVDNARNSLTKAEQSFADAVRKKSDTIKTNAMNEKSQEHSVTKAINNLETAQRSYNDAEKDYNNLTITSDYTGIISEVLVSDGDNVNNGTQLAKVYDSSTLKISLPFIEADADNISVGDTAEIHLASSNDIIYGNVSNISSGSVAQSSHAIVKYVTITVANPGSLTADDSASASVNGIYSSDLAKFEYNKEGYITAKVQGEILDFNLEKNDYVTIGQVLGHLKSDSIENNLINAKNNITTANISLDEAYDQLEKAVMESDVYSLDSSIKNAELSLADARTSLKNAEEKLKDYQITAPIDGTIITKNKKAGDKLENNNNSSNEPMAIIYDLSCLKVQLSVDETEVLYIKEGQEVSITADAVDGNFKGTVTKVGVNGTSENGVTVYPVDIVITEYGKLLPGMNVDCVIQVETAQNVLALPSETIRRGNKVYIKGEKENENDRAPDGFRTVRVTTGVTDGKMIEIKSGITENDEVCGSIIGTGNEPEGLADESQTAAQNANGRGGPMGGGPMGGAPGGPGGGPGGGMR